MNEKLCLITGGGSGIGRATAIKFAQNKINTIIVGRRNDALEETVSLADENSDFLKPVKADLSTENGINDLFNYVKKNFDNNVNILVNNAGSSSKIRSVAHIPKNQWDEVISINLNSVYLLCQKFLKDMIKSFFVYKFPKIRIGFLTPEERSFIPSFNVATPNWEAPPLIAYSDTTLASCPYPSALTTAIN